MSKRYGKPYDSKMSTPSKKPKLDITISSSQQHHQAPKPPSTSKNEPDPWGDDFNDEDIEEMDFVASQASTKSCSVSNGTTPSKTVPEPSRRPTCTYLNSKPSTSRSTESLSSSEPKKFEPKIPSKLTLSRKDSSQTNNINNQARAGNGSVNSEKQRVQPSQIISSSDHHKDTIKDEKIILFDDFKDNLLKVNSHNSTFQSQINNKRVHASNGTRTNVPGASDAINISDDSILRQLEKLQLENQKLLDNFITKEGETIILRNQLQQTQSRAERDKIEKSRQIEEQANRHRSEINLAIKKEENLRTQLDFQNLQLNNLKERCKLLESGSVKLMQPHTASLDPVNKNRLSTTLNRSSSGVKTVQVTETGIQTASFNLRNTYKLRKTVEIYPLCKIPQSIFEPSRVEPSVVEIQVIEKVGSKNLPILQDEENIRIFENPDLVKPIVTIINGQKLNVEFCSPDVAALMRKTEIEINSHNMFPTMNKLISVARELLLNTTLVLQRISQVIKNDDIRDMNDVYFSDFYKIHIDSKKSICDSNAWHDRERGIEAMRSIAILSYTASSSNYLSEYVAGKIPLNLFNDSNYEIYIKAMNSYNNWPKKNCQFEMMELLLEFVSTVGYVRRSHQFSGLIIAITKLLVSIKEKLINEEKGIDYIFKILKEIVFSRPLLVCYSHITELLMTFGQSVQFCKRLCVGTNKTAITVWKDERHFTSDACLMQIYIMQLEFYQPDPVAIIDITYALVCFVSNILSLNDIPWISQPGSACKCSMKLFGLTLNLLYKCSKVNLDEPVEKENYNYISSLKDTINEFYLSNETSQAVAQRTNNSSKTMSSNSEQLDEDVKLDSRHKQLLTMKKGIMFMCYLTTRDPDFIIRLSDIEDSFNLFIQQIECFSDLKLNETEQAALSSVKSTCFFERITSSEERSDKVERFSGIKKYTELKERSSSNRNQILKVHHGSTSSSQRMSKHPSWLSQFMSRRKK